MVTLAVTNRTLKLLFSIARRTPSHPYNDIKVPGYKILESSLEATYYFVENLEEVLDAYPLIRPCYEDLERTLFALTGVEDAIFDRLHTHSSGTHWDFYIYVRDCLIYIFPILVITGNAAKDLDDLVVTDLLHYYVLDVKVLLMEARTERGGPKDWKTRISYQLSKRVIEEFSNMPMELKQELIRKINPYVISEASHYLRPK